MRKLKLNELNLGSTEVLTREELKKVLGGLGSGGGSNPNCVNSDPCNAPGGWQCADGGKTNKTDCNEVSDKSYPQGIICPFY